MIEILAPSQFKTIPWKNGQGETKELAINDTGSLADFDWRLSIATVNSNGIFSDFSGYQRNLILIEGQGISLTHDNQRLDVLENVLDIANFDGGCKTVGELTSGVIKDFNVITKIDKVEPKVDGYVGSKQVQVELSNNNFCFAYSLSDEMVVQAQNAHVKVVPVGHLAKLSIDNLAIQAKPLAVTFTGKNMIIIQLTIL